jgi:hypothetical protein
MKLSGPVVCQDGKKKDITEATKPAVVIPKTLKRLVAGHRCKTATSLITKEDEKVIQKKIDD